jgi:peptide/nickel transport system substrate-binding protein
MQGLGVRKALIGLAGVSAMLLAACDTGGSGGTGPSASPTSSRPSNAVSGGTMRVGIWQEPTSFLDAGIVDSLQFSVVTDAPVAEGLLWVKSVQETNSAKTLADYWRPDLATEVPTVENGDVKVADANNATPCPDNKAAKMCVTWKLRKGVQWHDGSTFSSHDVCATYNLFWLKYGIKGAHNPTTLLSTSGWDYSLDCIEKDAQTAVIDFKAAYAPYLGLGSGSYGILPAALLDKAFAANQSIEAFQQTVDLSAGSKNPNAFKGAANMDVFLDGTGPFVFQKYTPGKDILLVKNNNYWDKDHQPFLDGIDFHIEASRTAEVTAVQSGDIDMGIDMRLANIDKIIQMTQANPQKVNLQAIPDSGAEKIDLNLCAGNGGKCGANVKGSVYLADQTIRRAMLYGINRKGVVHAVTHDKTDVAPDSFMSLGAAWIQDPKVPTTPFDADKARKLLDDAGYKVDPACFNGQGRKFKDGTCIAVDFGTTSSDPARVDAQKLIAADLNAIGIHVNDPFKPNVDAGTFFGTFADGGPLYTHQFDMAQYTNTMSSPAEPDSYWSGYYSTQIPTAANDGQGQNDTGISNPDLDKALDAGRNSLKLSDRQAAYHTAQEILADQLPEIPLFRQVTVDSYSVKLHGVQDNDVIWDFNTYDWWCDKGDCKA